MLMAGGKSLSFSLATGPLVHFSIATGFLGETLTLRSQLSLTQGWFLRDVTANALSVSICEAGANER